VTLHNANDLEY